MEEELVIKLKWNKSLREWDIKPLYVELKAKFNVEVTRGLKGVFTSGTSATDNYLRLVNNNGNLQVKTSKPTDEEVLLAQTQVKIYSKTEKTGFKFTIEALVTMLNTYWETQDV